jgi:hypothetical protein
MTLSVRADVVAGRRDLGDQSGMPIGDPAEHEERGADAGAIELVEHQPRGLDDP